MFSAVNLVLSVCTHSGIMHTLHACLHVYLLATLLTCTLFGEQKTKARAPAADPDIKLTVPEDQSPFSFSFCTTESHCVIIQVISALTVLHCVTLQDKNTQTFWLLATLQESMQVFACKWD